MKGGTDALFRPLSEGNHATTTDAGSLLYVFVDTTTAEDLEEVFAQFQAEVMTETRHCRVLLKPIRHTSMSVGDLVIDETGHCFAVMPMGFERVEGDTLESRTELALHLLSLGLERSTGWTELFAQDPALLAAAVVDRLRNDAYGVGSYASKPYTIRPASGNDTRSMKTSAGG